MGIGWAAAEDSRPRENPLLNPTWRILPSFFPPFKCFLKAAALAKT